MNEREEAEMSRTTEVLREVFEELKNPTQKEAVEMAALALVLVATKGFWAELEDSRKASGEPLTEGQLAFIARIVPKE